MKRVLWLAAVVAAVIGPAGPSDAHPVPFTYLDLHLQPGALHVTLVAHMVDVAHDLGIAAPEQLLDDAVLRGRGADVVRLLGSRLRVVVDGAPVTDVEWSEAVDALPERQSVRIQGRSHLPRWPGIVVLEARLFPYDPMHQTFVNVYEAETLQSQAILDASRARIEYFTGTRQGTEAVMRRFVPTGLQGSCASARARSASTWTSTGRCSRSARQPTSTPTFGSASRL